MSIEEYKLLILNLPVGQQCFKTKRTTWKTAENKFDWFHKLNDKLFADQKDLTISRNDIFEVSDAKKSL